MKAPCSEMGVGMRGGGGALGAQTVRACQGLLLTRTKEHCLQKASFPSTQPRLRWDDGVVITRQELLLDGKCRFNYCT